MCAVSKTPPPCRGAGFAARADGIRVCAAFGSGSANHTVHLSPRIVAYSTLEGLFDHFKVLVDFRAFPHISCHFPEANGGVARGGVLYNYNLRNLK